MVQEKWLVNPGESRTIDLEIVRSLKIGLIGGHVDVIAHDEPGCRVEVHDVVGKDLKITMEGDRLEIDHPQMRWDNFIDVFKSWTGRARADVSVLVPRDVELKLGVVSADAFVSGVHSDAKLSTVSGDLVTDSLMGALDVNTVSGELSLRSHTGRVRAHTVSGDVTATGQLTRFACESVSGDVFLDAFGPVEEISNNSVSGDMTIRIDATHGARYRINTVSGRLQLGEPITVQGTKRVTYQSGSLDGRWVEVSLNSVGGGITVMRRYDDNAADTSQSSEASL